MPRASGRTTNARKALVLAAEPIREPGAHRREAHLAKTAVRLKRAGDVIRGLGDHRLDHRQLIGDAGDLGEEIGHPESALPASTKCEVRPVEPTELAEEGVGLAELLRHVLAVIFLQLGLEVERVDLAQAPAEEDVDDVPGLGLEVRADATGRSAGAACKCPPRSSRSAAAIAGTAKAASRRKSRRVDLIRGLSSGAHRCLHGTGPPSVDEYELVRVEQHEAELIEAVPRREATASRASRSFGGRAKANRQARSTCRERSSPASRRIRPANCPAHFSMNVLFDMDNACTGVIVRVRLGVMTDGSGQSSDSSRG